MTPANKFEVSSLPVTWQRWQSHHSICRSRKPHAACKHHGSFFIERELLPIGVLHCGNRNCRPFWLLWPWPWPFPMTCIYEVDPCIPRRYTACANMNFLRTSGLWKVIVWQTDRQTGPKLYTTPLRYCELTVRTKIDVLTSCVFPYPLYADDTWAVQVP